MNERTLRNELQLEIWSRKIKKNFHPEIKLLRDKEVLRYISGDCSFLGDNSKDMKHLEDKWGQKLLNLPNQWSGLFGEKLLKEVYLLQGKNIWRPNIINRLRPDWETAEEIIEVKTQTYFTTGTAGEKVMSVPIKYIDAPALYNKPLKIIAVGKIEQLCRFNYFVIDVDETLHKRKKEIIEYFENNYGIYYVGFTDLLKSVLDNI